MKKLYTLFLIVLSTCLASISLAQAVSSLVVSQASAWGGTENPYIYVYLASGATSKRTISLTSSNPNACAVPATVTIGVGSNNNYFYVATAAVSSDTNVTITAEGKTVQLLVKANRPSSLTISATSAWGGTENPYIYAYLGGAAKPGGQVVALTSSDPAACAVPENFVISGGTSNNYFYLKTFATDEDKDVTITATCNGGSQDIHLLVKANRPTSIVSSADTLWGGTGNPYCYVYLGGPARTGGFDVALSSSDPTRLQVPATVKISGGSTNNYFYYTTGPTLNDKVVRITATLNGGSKFVDVLVKANGPDHFGTPKYVVVGGTASTYDYVFLKGPAPNAGATIALQSSQPSVLTLPATLTVTGGSNSNYFYFNTVPVSRVHYVNVSASFLAGSIFNTYAVRPAAITLSGQFFFEGLGDIANRPSTVTLEYREPGTGTVFGSATATVYDDSSYTVPMPRSTAFDISVKVGSWLRRTITVPANGGNIAFADLNLVNGDIDGDNSVTIVDYSILSDYFDMDESNPLWNTVGGNGFRPVDADLDRDGAVTIVDYSLLSNSWDLTGDN